MVTLEDDEDSNDGSSDNDVDETMEDLDEGDRDGAGDGEADADNEEDNDENEEDEDQDEESPSRSMAEVSRSAQGANSNEGSQSKDNTQAQNDPRAPSEERSKPSSPRAALEIPSIQLRPSVRPEALTAKIYDIVPTIAAPHSTSINAVTATPDMRWVFSGGSDGYIRKFNWVDTVNGRSMLTVAQRHPFVDSVTKAGVLMSYWENEESTVRSPTSLVVEESNSLSPVYSLAVHRHGLWLLSGLDNGGIKLQTVRHDEGKQITILRGHSSAVSAMILAQDEQTVLSGSWDKSIIDWDLNTGQIKRSFKGSGSQIAVIEMRPESSLPVPREAARETEPSTTMHSSNAAAPNSKSSSGIDPFKSLNDETNGIRGSPDSLGSLFGDNDETADPTGVPSFGEDDEFGFSESMTNGIPNTSAIDAGGEESMDINVSTEDPNTSAAATAESEVVQSNSKDHSTQQDALVPSESLSNGLPHAVDSAELANHITNDEASTEPTCASDNVFLDAAIDGTLRIWDRRQSTPISKIVPPRSVPPWCMNACWSHDGNFIYAGRRNGTVEEYSLHKGLREPKRTFKFPPGSGAVSAVRSMPNGVHLICASYDILRLYDLREQEASKHSLVPFLIVPGHQTGVVSQLFTDPTCRYLITTAGNRGWEGSSKEVLLGYEIGIGS